MILYEVAGADDRRLSPYCWRVKWALAHKGLAFETAPLAYTQIATVGDGSFTRVPILDTGGEWWIESFDIARRLDAAYPDRPSLMRGESGLSFARFLDGWTESMIHNPTFGMVAADMWGRLQEVDKPYFRRSRESFLGVPLEVAEEGRAERLPAFHEGLAPLATLLAGQPFLGGDGPDYGDYIVASAFRWLAVVSDLNLLPSAGPIPAWLARLAGRCG
ncbi:glutathione S-transferase N-terminal domain-containing protein [Ancylobacter sp. WKF20]|uniref:glutathione S-transferase N-terminal domain-containing protein n=1 Tax=Ancylobacter sp. WKF20 TaxID=3039801 RepID=UPI0024343B12|nr:glutathione S-transferase N-terminal domain-containing protein [Ancylobacter sp. WKF20]WGD29737.1 glutathione S-transferase N-terminal domain-containing protein [Ancylobacter sp. WKF20]